MGIVPAESVIQGCQATINFLREYRCPNMLNDNRALMNSWSIANDWITAKWVPQVLRLGLRRFAHIVPPGIFGQASAAELVTRVSNQPEIASSRMPPRPRPGCRNPTKNTPGLLLAGAEQLLLFLFRQAFVARARNLVQNQVNFVLQGLVYHGRFLAAAG